MREVKIKRKDGELDTVSVYDINDFPYNNLSDKYTLCRHTKKPRSYKKTIATFDIESTTIVTERPFGYMYTWQMNIAGVVVVGRRWEEWLSFMQEVREKMDISSDSRLVIWVHNLGYEFQFIKDFINEYFGGFKIFASQERKPIRLECNNGFEFRCSYKLTNMSLAKACENELGVIHPKAVDDLDYKQIRTADTILSDKEWGYIVSDVVSLYELIENRLKNEGDNLESIPMTSTGYVRRDCRNASRKQPRYREKFVKLQMDSEIYQLMQECARGGNTHANRFVSGRIMHDVSSLDVVSSYPAQMLLQQFPMSKFYYYGDIDTMQELHQCINENACMFRVFLKNVEIRDNVSMPYIAVAKCTMKAGKSRYDNGRVLYQEGLALSVTDVDWKIIEKQYVWSEIAIKDMFIADYGDLPESLRGQVMQYYKKKCELKHEIKLEESKETPDESKLDNLHYLYGKIKNRLNGIFGMCYTNPVHEIISYDDNGWSKEKPRDIDSALEKFWKNRNNFLYYAWGVWVCCWGRKHLQDLLDVTDEGCTIYCDTDSSKAVNVNFKKIEKLNNDIMKLADKRGAYCDIEGERFYLGVYELENKIDKSGNIEYYPQFITLGAKKYAYTELKNGKEELHLTVSGVNKKLGAKELRNIDNFKLGFTFSDAGGSTLYYNDENRIYEITIDGCKMLTSSNIGMIDSTYTIGITSEYAELIGLQDINKIF